MENNTSSTPETLSVKDLALSSFLLSSDELKLVKVERANNTVYFHFTPRSRAEELMVAYLSENAPTVQPRKLFDAMKNLKDLIFSGGQ